MKSVLCKRPRSTLVSIGDILSMHQNEASTIKAKRLCADGKIKLGAAPTTLELHYGSPG